MFKFIIRRIIQTIPVLIGVSILVFSMMHLVPGDPAQIMAGESAPKEQVENIRERLGLNDPLPVQYFNYVKDAVQGDLGNSMRSGRDVTAEIGARFWVTVELAIYSTVVAVFIGLIVGVISATKRYSLADTSLMILALLDYPCRTSGSDLCLSNGLPSVLIFLAGFHSLVTPVGLSHLVGEASHRSYYQF